MCKLDSNFARGVVIAFDSGETQRVNTRCKFCSHEAVMCPNGSLVFCRTSISNNSLIQRQVHILHTLLRGHPIAVMAAVSTLVVPRAPLSKVISEVLRFSGGSAMSREGLSTRLIRVNCRGYPRMRRPKRFSVHNKVVSVFSVARRGPCQVRL